MLGIVNNRVLFDIIVRVCVCFVHILFCSMLSAVGCVHCFVRSDFSVYVLFDVLFGMRPTDIDLLQDFNFKEQVSTQMSDGQFGDQLTLWRNSYKAAQAVQRSALWRTNQRATASTCQPF